MPTSQRQSNVIGLLLLALVAAVVYSAVKQGKLTSDQLLYFVALVPSVVLHEVSHGYLAYLYGDDTAKRAGRLTLNPIRHVDPLGTFIIPAVLILTTGRSFGYAKPVPVNTSRMSRNQAMFTGLVGPATNIVISLVVAGVLHLIFWSGNSTLANHWVVLFLFELGVVNVVLAVFNLIPIPPLDGASVVERFLPDRYMQSYLNFQQYSMFVLMAVVLLFSNRINMLFDPAIRLWVGLLP